MCVLGCGWVCVCGCVCVCLKASSTIIDGAYKDVFMRCVSVCV